MIVNSHFDAEAMVKSGVSGKTNSTKHHQAFSSGRCISNLILRVSSLLYLYPGIQEAVRQSDWLFTILRGNSALRGVNGRSMSKFAENHILYLLQPYLQSISEIRRTTSHVTLEAAVKVSLILNLGPLSPQTNRTYLIII